MFNFNQFSTMADRRYLSDIIVHVSMESCDSVCHLSITTKLGTPLYEYTFLPGDKARISFPEVLVSDSES